MAAVPSASKRSLVVGVDPSARNHPRAVAGSDRVLESVDQRVERGGIHEPLLDEQRLESLDAQRGVGRDIFVIVLSRWLVHDARRT